MSNVSSFTQYPASQLIKLCLIPSLHVWSDFSCAVFVFGESHEVKYVWYRCWKSVARNSNGYSSWLKWCNLSVYISMKRDFFILGILHENSLRLPFYFMFCTDLRFSVFPHFSHAKWSVRSLNIVRKLTNQCSCPRLYIRQYGVSGCKLHMRKPNWPVVLGSRISSSFAELKGHEHVAVAVIVGVNTCFCICFSRL